MVRERNWSKGGRRANDFIMKRVVERREMGETRNGMATPANSSRRGLRRDAHFPVRGPTEKHRGQTRGGSDFVTFGLGTDPPLGLAVDCGDGSAVAARTAKGFPTKLLRNIAYDLDLEHNDSMDSPSTDSAVNNTFVIDAGTTNVQFFHRLTI